MMLGIAVCICRCSDVGIWIEVDDTLENRSESARETSRFAFKGNGMRLHAIQVNTEVYVYHHPNPSGFGLFGFS